MTELEKLANLLTEAGPRLDAIELIEQTTDDTWLVIVDEETAVEVHADPVGRVLGFSMLLGTPQPEQQLEMYQAMLTYSFLKSETGGFHMALDGDDGNAHLMLDVCLAEMTPDQLAGVLAAVLETGATWRAALLGEPAPDDEASDEPAEGAVGGIQV